MKANGQFCFPFVLLKNQKLFIYPLRVNPWVDNGSRSLIFKGFHLKNTYFPKEPKAIKQHIDLCKIKAGFFSPLTKS